MSQPLQVRASYATSPMRSSGLSMQESRAVHHVSLVCVCVFVCPGVAWITHRRPIFHRPLVCRPSATAASRGGQLLGESDAASLQFNLCLIISAVCGLCRTCRMMSPVTRMA